MDEPTLACRRLSGRQPPKRSAGAGRRLAAVLTALACLPPLATAQASPEPLMLAPAPLPVLDHVRPLLLGSDPDVLMSVPSLPFTAGTSDGLVRLAAANAASGGYGGASGLPWKSGAACGGAPFANWRGRKFDVGIGWAPKTSWAELVRYFQRGGAKRVASGGRASIGLPLLTEQSSGRFSDCAAGKFDGYFKSIGQYLSSQGTGSTIVRLGWEANGDSYPWKVAGNASGYKACFARAVTALRSTAPGVQIAWHMAKKGKHNGSVTELYPGDAYVNEVSLSYYDRYPFHTNATVWAQQYNATNKGGPYGLGAWLGFARGRGKKLSIGEWGVNDGYPGGGTDNAFYVQKMGEFFRANAASIGHEGYYNCTYKDPGQYRIYPTSSNPRAAAAYLAGWSR